MRAGDHRGAATHFSLAASAGADPVLSLGGEAECRYYLGHYDAALALCDRLNASAPNAGRAHTVRGLVYLRQSRTADAMNQFREAVRHGDWIAATLLPVRVNAPDDDDPPEV
jgi:tetratricopeptide (TPR) repeat protein